MKNHTLFIPLLLLLLTNACKNNNTQNAEDITIPVQVYYISENDSTLIKPDINAQVRIYYDIEPSMLVIANYVDKKNETYISIGDVTVLPDEVYFTDGLGKCTLIPQCKNRNFSVLVISKHFAPSFTVFDSSSKNFEMVFSSK